MGSFLRRRPKTYVSVHLNARVQPLDRHAIYEDPLEWMLKNVLRGGKITGGGSLHHPDRGIESCDIELEIPGDPEAAERVIIRTLESVGAPRGSWIRVGEGPEIPFGRAAGVKLALNGFRLPEKVYAENDPLDLALMLAQDLRGIARLQSYWEVLGIPSSTSMEKMKTGSAWCWRVRRTDSRLRN